MQSTVQNPVFVAILLMTSTGCGLFSPPPACPEVPDAAVFQPVLELTDGRQFQAGKAFIVGTGSRSVVLTAHHLFGPDGGLDEQLEPKDLPNKVAYEGLLDAYTGKQLLVARRVLVVPGAKPMTGGWDVAAFSAQPEDLAPLSDPPAQVHAMNLGADPSVGDYVCVASPSQADSDARTFLARVSEIDASFIWYKYLVPFEMQATSGAPVLAMDGSVVGMNLGGRTSSGTVTGMGNFASALADRIASIDMTQPTVTTP